MVRGQESPLSASPALATVKARARKAGLRFWMERVLEECDRVSAGFGPDPVHDLRVALRRCRSIADGFIALDPDPAWKEMKKAGRRLFSRLGELRDVHVMQEWVGKLASPSDPSAIALLQFLAAREIELKQEAALEFNEFNRKQWRRWSIKLPRRTTRLRQGSMILSTSRSSDGCTLTICIAVRCAAAPGLHFTSCGSASSVFATSSKISCRSSMPRGEVT